MVRILLGLLFLVIALFLFTSFRYSPPINGEALKAFNMIIYAPIFEEIIKRMSVKITGQHNKHGIIVICIVFSIFELIYTKRPIPVFFYLLVAHSSYMIVGQKNILKSIGMHSLNNIAAYSGIKILFAPVMCINLFIFLITYLNKQPPTVATRSVRRGYKLN